MENAMNTEMHRDEIQRQKQRIAFDLKELCDATEALLRATAGYTGAEIDATRERLREQLDRAKSHGADWQQRAQEGARNMAQCADRYVHENPWHLVGVAALTGVVVGHCLLGCKR